MIDFLKQTPSAYHESRDFQLLSKFFDVLLASCKTYSDTIKYVKNGQIRSIADLNSLTNNFVTRHDWEDTILEGVNYCFKYLMRNKGTLFAIKSCINILMRLYDIPSSHGAIVTTAEEFRSNFMQGQVNKYTTPFIEPTVTSYKLYIVIPSTLAERGIIQDLLDYLLPIGVSYRIIGTDIIDRTFEDVIITDAYHDTKKPRLFFDDRYLTLSSREGSDNIDITEETKYVIPGRQVMYNKVIRNAGTESTDPPALGQVPSGNTESDE